MSDEVQQFPDVDPQAIIAAGQQFQQSAANLTTAGNSVHTVAGTTAWSSTSARPAWDGALTARRADIADAQSVTEHIGNVLRTTGAELDRLRTDWSAAVFAMLVNPDPRAGHTIQVGSGILVPDGKPIDQVALTQYLAQVTKANNAVSDAEYALALCARELISASAGVSFAPLPSSPPPVTVDPTSFSIIPITPAFGAPSGAVFANGVPVQFPIGRAFEAQILRTLGISGDSKSFFRPDANGNYSLPRTASGRLFRGTFPDSMRGGLLEIKSGQTEIKMSMAQMRVQQFIARQLGIKWNMVVGENTPVNDDVLDAVNATGGAVYRAVPGQTDVFRDARTGQLVRLSGGGGTTGQDLAAQPLTPQETRAVSLAMRMAQEDGPSDPPTPPTADGPDQPYVTEQDYDTQWGNADISPDGDTPLPGVPTEEEPGGPFVPGETPIEPVEPIEPIIPIEPGELIP